MALGRGWVGRLHKDQEQAKVTLTSIITHTILQVLDRAIEQERPVMWS